MASIQRDFFAFGGLIAQPQRRRPDFLPCNTLEASRPQTSPARSGGGLTVSLRWGGGLWDPERWSTGRWGIRSDSLPCTPWGLAAPRLPLPALEVA